MGGWQKKIKRLGRQKKIKKKLYITACFKIGLQMIDILIFNHFMKNLQCFLYFFCQNMANLS